MPYSPTFTEDASLKRPAGSAARPDLIERQKVEFRKRIDNVDLRSLFMEGCCADFALALAGLMQDKEIIYFQAVCQPTEMAHIAIKISNTLCLDFSGLNNTAELAEKYSGFSDIQPTTTPRGALIDIIHKRGLSTDLQHEISHIAEVEAKKLFKNL